MTDAVRKPSSHVARVEDEDPETGEAVRGTAVEAKKRRAREASSRPSDAGQVNGPASDSGYSSSYAQSLYATTSQASAEDRSTPAPAVSNTSSTLVRRSSAATRRPIVHGGHAVSSSTPATASACDDPSCRDPSCSGLDENPERRFIIPGHERRPAAPEAAPRVQKQYHARPPPPQSQPPLYPSHAPRQYQDPHAGQMLPPPLPPHRRRGSSSANARPLSFHGYPQPSMPYSYDASAYGPPPAQSAYARPPYYPQPHAVPPPQPSYFGSTPPNPMPLNFPMASPSTPTSPPAVNPMYISSMSARQGNPNMASFGASKPPPPFAVRRPSLSGPKVSARYGPVEIAAAPEPDSDSDSRSDDDYSDRERRGSRSHAQRPAIMSRHTTASTTGPRGILRAPQANESRTLSDTAVDYHNRLDQQAHSSHSSRRPSASRTDPAGHTRALVAETGLVRVLVQDSQGHRKVEYWSERDVANARRRSEQDQHLEDAFDQLDLEDKIEGLDRKIKRSNDYVRANGTDSLSLSAAELREATRAQQQSHRTSGSHLTRRSSHKSRASGSRISSAGDLKSEGFIIQHGENSVHVTGDMRIDLRQNEDGGAPVLMLTTNGMSGRDSGYLTSSNRSRSGVGGVRSSEYGAPRSARRMSRRLDDDYDESGYERAR